MYICLLTLAYHTYSLIGGITAKDLSIVADIPIKELCRSLIFPASIAVRLY